MRGQYKKSLIRLWIVVAALLVPAQYVHAQDASSYPTGPITIVIGYAPAGPTDILLRVMSDTVQKELQVPVVIVNKPGAASSLSIAQLITRPADGYTLAALLVGAVVNQHIRDTGYDTNADITPIIMFGQQRQGIVVRPDAPWKTLKEFLDFAKSKPEAIRYSTAGIGTPQHLVMERLGAELGIKWIHVPYKGGVLAVSAAEKGEVDASAQTAEWKQAVKEGRLRLLTTFSAERMTEFPEVSTLREAGFDIVAPSLMGIVGPKGMDSRVVKKVHDAFKAAMADEKFLALMDNLAVQVAHRGPDDFKKYIAQTNAFYSDAVKKAGIAEKKQ